MSGHATPEAPVRRGFVFSTRPATFAVLWLLATLPFLPGLPGALVLDDVGNLEFLLPVRPEWEDLWRATWSNPSGLLLRPISNLSFALNLVSTGTDIAALKLTNIALHGCSTLAMFVLATRLVPSLVPQLPVDRRVLTALIAALVWAWHPMQVSTVLYTVQRMSILSALFSALALASLMRRSTPARQNLADTLLFFGYTTLALLSKENGALTPLLAASVIATAPASIIPRFKQWAGIVVPLGLGLVSVALLWNSLLSGYGGRDFTLVERLVTQPKILFGYVLNLALPLPGSLSLFRDDTPVLDPQLALDWIWLLGGLATLLAAAIVRRRYPLLAFSVFWFCACHAMESTFLPLEMAFEHRNYLAIFGPALAITAAVLRWWPQERHAGLAAASCLAPLLALAGLASHRAAQWSSEDSLARLEVANRPDSMRANNLMAIVERRQGDTASPVARMRRMQTLYPNTFFPWAAEMDFACDLGSQKDSIPWEHIRQTALATGGSSEVLGYFNHIALKIRAGQCRGIAAAEFDRELERLAEGLRTRDLRTSAQYLLVLRASLQEADSPDSARQLFSQALELGVSAELLDRLVQFEAAYGDPDKARMWLQRYRELDWNSRLGAARAEQLERLILAREQAMPPAAGTDR